MRGGFGVIDGLFAAGAKLIEAKIDTRNRASLGLVAALGFAFIEKRIAVEWFKNAWSDEELWRLTRAAWEGRESGAPTPPDL
jgi:RimJ/RimL family protein N-acetyltransferase